jgi:cell division septum initiation protein DivIVA
MDVQQSEIERLRRRVEELERELAERTARAEAAVAAAQDRSYWLDRMPFDFNALMRQPLARGAFEALTAFAKGLRAVKARLVRR